MGNRLGEDFFIRDVLDVAPDLLGKIIKRTFADGTTKNYIITETEAYKGIEDKACHACKGRTLRTEVMFHEGGIVYAYLIYGIHWMLNVVTGEKDDPQAVLIRGVKEFVGPGKVSKELQIDKSFYGEDLTVSNRIWIEDSNITPNYITKPRVGIDYAGEYWKDIHWRFILTT